MVSQCLLLCLRIQRIKLARLLGLFKFSAVSNGDTIDTVVPEEPEQRAKWIITKGENALL